MTLNRLLLLHAALTFAAGVVLIAAPDQIPGAVGITLGPGAYLLCYLLGAAEISLAALSFFATRLRDKQAIRFVCLTFVSLHSVTAGVEVLALARGLSPSLWWNVLLRVAVAGLFWWYGLRPGAAHR